MTTSNIIQGSTIQPYLFFNGRCEEAIGFYREALGAEVEMMLRFKECPDAGAGGESCSGPMPDGEKIMHATLRIGQATVLASDGCEPEATGFQGFALSYNVASEEEARKVFGALSEGGKVQMPLGKTFFSACFGVVEDRFGLGWMVILPQ